MNDAPRLVVESLTKTFAEGEREVSVLRGAALTASVGDSVAIMGPSGSGKSTLLHCVGTLEPPTTGTVMIDGADPFALSEPEIARFRNSTVGFVFQDHHLLPQYSVLENALLPTVAFRSANDSQDRARSLLDRVGLAHRLDHRPGELSGGERQRVAIARALINQPGLLLCDEPTGNLDGPTADSVADLLLELHAEADSVLLVVTHSEHLAARFARHVDLQDGKCVER
ncbi:MAG: ATP-binding cassette domain-containing protein [Acidobacteria bacterium]|nr:ATP-binding cassette domain-containing protein [Acidobacteriota bacterium]